MTKNSLLQDPGPAIAAAIELMIRQGFTATSVDELADAAGMSRSTFFRRFGSKEDVVFADHERLLARVGDYLSATTADPLTAVTNAALMVFDEHLLHRETSLLRNQLLHEVPVLRERELVMTHRYEHAFRHHLLATLPKNERRDYVAVAFSAAVVAVHNSTLRRWLREAAESPGNGVDQNLSARLSRELRALAEIFRSPLSSSPASGGDRPAVVVTILDPGAGTEQILDAVRQALP